MALLSLSSAVVADIAVPNAGPTLPENAASGLATPIRSAARTYQAYYSSANFTAVTSPTTFTGIQFRLALGRNWQPSLFTNLTWPPVDLTIANYEITLAKPSAQLVSNGEYVSTAPTFASYLSSPVVVRTGALVIPANSFVGDQAGEQPWGLTIPFLNNYTINPGDGLVLQLRLTGYSPSGTPNAFFASTPFANGFTDAIVATTSNTATNPDNFTSPIFANFIVPSPSAAAMVGFGGLFAFRRRR